MTKKLTSIGAPGISRLIRKMSVAISAMVAMGSPLYGLVDRLRSEHDAGGGHRRHRSQVAVGLQGGMVVAAGQGTQVVHGVGADGGDRGALAERPAPTGRAGQLQQH